MEQIYKHILIKIKLFIIISDHVYVIHGREHSFESATAKYKRKGICPEKILHITFILEINNISYQC